MWPWASHLTFPWIISTSIKELNRNYFIVLLIVKFKIKIILLLQIFRRVEKISFVKTQSKKKRATDNLPLLVRWFRLVSGEPIQLLSPHHFQASRETSEASPYTPVCLLSVTGGGCSKLRQEVRLQGSAFLHIHCILQSREKERVKRTGP